MRALAAIALSTAATAQPAPRAESTPDPASRATVIGRDLPPASTPAPQRPEAAQRIVRHFDFERRLDDPDRAELFDLPRFWSLAQDTPDHPRPGYPRWNRATIDDAAAFQGTSSLRLETRGGGTSLRLQPGVAPVFPSTPYLVSAKIRTENLNHARALLVARYLDQSSQPIPGTELTSELLAPGPAPWALATVALPPTIPAAAFIQVDLEIVQPEQFTEPTLGRHQVWPQDFNGAAWFDDVAIIQLPSVHMSVDAPGHVVAAPAVPRIDVRVRDLTGEALAATMVLQDAAGIEIDRLDRAVASGNDAWTWQPRVAALGWYRAVLELSAQGRRVGAASVDLLWAPAPAARRAREHADLDRLRFGVALRDWSADQRRGVEHLVRAAASGTVIVPAWDRALTPELASARAAELARAAASWAVEGRATSLSLAAVPDALAEPSRLTPDDTLALLRRPASSWLPYIEPFLDRVGQSVSRWQLGAPRWMPRPDTPGDQGPSPEFLAKLAALAPGATIARPADAERPPEPAGLDTEPASPVRTDWLVPIDPGLPPAAAAALARTWLDAAPSHTRTFMLRADDAAPSPRDASAQLARQAIALWSVVAPASTPRLRDSLALDQPWSWHAAKTQAEPRPQPHATLAAWRTLAERLGPRRVVGAFPTEDGVQCYILAPAHEPGPGALVAWATAPAKGDGEPVLEAFLGQGTIDRVDLNGNATPIAPTAGPTPSHRITLTHEPVFIEPVDVELAQFVASFRVTPRILTPTSTEQTIALELANPWPQRVSGRLTITEPLPGPDGRSWRASPRVHTFAADPGQRVSLPVTFTLAEVEEAEQRQLGVLVELTGAVAYPPIALRAPIEVALPELSMDLTASRAPGPGGPDLVVQSQITNRSASTVTIALGLFAPQRPRQRASITDLAPGATASTKFVIPGAAELRGQRITVSAAPLERAGRLNRTIVVE